MLNVCVNKLLWMPHIIFVTGPGKTGLIYTKYTCLYYGTYLLFCMRYPKSVNFIEFLMDFCIYDDIFNIIQITNKKLLHFKLSKSGQILRVDKTCFPRPSHILTQTFCQVEITMHVLLIKPLLATYTSILLQRQSYLCRVLLIAIGDMCACLKIISN